MQKQWSKILKGHIDIRDFMFAREVKLGKYTCPPPAALVAEEIRKRDIMLTPKYGERVKYLVIAGALGSKVKDMVVSPDDYNKDHRYKLNSKYYIERVINNALHRVFVSFRVNVSGWYFNIPKGLSKTNLLVNQIHFMGSTTNTNVPKALNYNLEKFFTLQICILCFEQAEDLICQRCINNPSVTQIMCLQKIRYIEKEANTLEKACKACTGLTMFRTGEVICQNFDCNVYYPKITIKDKIKNINSKLKYVVDSLNY